jgi:transcription elongation factor Elf1
MAGETDEASDIPETDIIFECPHCGKSLAIDPRGAGLTIACPDCGNQLQVPIPAGMEIADIDSSSEEQEIRIIHMREIIAEHQARIAVLEQHVQDLEQRRDVLERLRTEDIVRFDVIGKEMEIVQRSLRRIEEVLASASDAIRKTEPKPPGP